MNILTIFIIMFLTSIIKTIYICNTIIFYYYIKFSNSLFNFLSTWSNNTDIFGNILDLLSALGAIVIPILLYYFQKKDEKARRDENEKNEKRNQELLSIERRGKLYSKPVIDRDKDIILYYDNIYKAPNPKTECELYATNSNSSFKLVRLSISLKEEGIIDISKFLIEKLELHFCNNDSSSKGETFFFDNREYNEFKDAFISNNDSILNINLYYTDDSNLVDCFKKDGICRIVFTLKVINPLNIQSNGTWNAILFLGSKIIIDEEKNNISFKIKDSLLRIEEIIDKNLEEQK